MKTAVRTLCVLLCFVMLSCVLSVVVGAVTTAFAAMLLSQPKPSDIEAFNKMTPFFNIFFDNGFQSCHWGTELYNPQEKQ